MPETFSLLGDIGGSHARFALLDDAGALMQPRILPCAAYTSLEAALTHYLHLIGQPRIERAALALANPITGDRMRLTNLDWSFSQRQLQAQMGWRQLQAVNDFAALALALPHLTNNDLTDLGVWEAAALTPQQPAVKGLIGPGTGLGVGYLVPTPGGWQAQASEGGHVSLAAANEQEAALLACLWREFPHVSAERLLCGSGLPLLYRTVAKVRGVAATPVADAAALSALAAEDDALAKLTLEIFSAWLGGVAGNLALSLGCQGGLYVGGGVIPRLGALFDAAAFRARFIAKGRFTAYLQSIPIRLIVAEYPAFIGLAALLGK